MEQSQAGGSGPAQLNSTTENPSHLKWLAQLHTWAMVFWFLMLDMNQIQFAPALETQWLLESSKENQGGFVPLTSDISFFQELFSSSANPKICVFL